MSSTRHPRLEPTVLFVAPRSTRGGPNQSLGTLLGALPDVRRIVAAPGHFPDDPGVVDERLTLARDPVPGRRQRGVAALRLAQWAVTRRRRIDAIHVNGVSGLNLAGPAAALVRRPVVVWMHASRLSDVSLRLGRFWARRLRRFVRWAAVSATTREMLSDAGLASPASVEIVPNPIGENKLTQRRSGDRVTVAYLGGPAVYKGIHLVPGVMELLADRDIRWFVVAGRQPTAEKQNPIVESLAAMAGSDVEISGWVADPRRIYAAAGIVFCPSFRESFGRVAAEAMANGIPVVASDLPAYRELLGDDEAGLLFPAGDAKAAAAALRRLSDDAALRATLGDAGRRRAARFAPDTVATAMRELYGIVPSPPDGLTGG